MTYTIYSYAQRNDGSIVRLRKVRECGGLLLAERVCDDLNRTAGAAFNPDGSFQIRKGVAFYMIDA